MLNLKNEFYKVQKTYITQFPGHEDVVEFSDTGIGSLVNNEGNDALCFLSPKYYSGMHGPSLQGYDRFIIDWAIPDMPLVTCLSVDIDYRLLMFAQFSDESECSLYFPEKDVDLSSVPLHKAGLVVKGYTHNLFCDFDHKTRNFFMCINYLTYQPIQGGDCKVFSECILEVKAEVES